MLTLLNEALVDFLAFLKDLDYRDWRSAATDFNGALAERLWRPYHDSHLVLQRSHPCPVGQATCHYHTGPVAVRILSGCCEMGVGYGEITDPPVVASRVILPSGSLYEMAEPEGWHWVRPLDQPSLSLMLTGPLWDCQPDPLAELAHCSPLAESRIVSVFNEAIQVFCFGKPFPIPVS